MFGDAGRGVGRYIDKTWRIVAFGHNHHGVIQRASFAEVGHNLGDGGSALTDRTVDADQVLPALVQYSVDGDGRLARLAITQNQLALAPPDRNERIDDL